LATARTVIREPAAQKEFLLILFESKPNKQRFKTKTLFYCAHELAKNFFTPVAGNSGQACFCINTKQAIFHR